MATLNAATAGRCYTGGVHIIVEMRPRGSESWELLGRFQASPEEIAALRGALAQHENPYDALSSMPRGLLWDTLDVCRGEGHEARVTFLKES